MLLDVTGATKAKACNAKADAIARNVRAVETAVQADGKSRLKVSGVLLAPNCDRVGDGTGEVVLGAEARDLLGGLQHFAWRFGRLATHGQPGQSQLL